MPDLTDMTRADLERMRTALDLILRCSDKASAAGFYVRFHRSGDEFGLTLGSGEIAARDAAGPAEARHIDDAGEPMPAVAVTTVREDASPEAPAYAPRPSMPPATSDLSAFTVVSEDRPETSRRDPQAAHAVASNLRAPGWTPEEDARALEMANRGAFAAEIAETLGRPLRGVQQRLRKLRTRDAAAPAVTKGPTGRPDPDNRAKAETRAATPKDAKGMGEAKDAGKPAPEARPQPMRRDGGRGGQANHPTTDRPSWKPSQIDMKPPTGGDVAQAEMDQEILELLGAGHKSGAVAEMLEVPKDVVVARYTSLVPCRSYEGQIKALERVREIVRAGREVRA